jgi:formylglycine-generating enzyme required for sulfatase activity
MPDTPPIFINYRRSKTRDKALILRWILEKEFGIGVSFLDEATIAPGCPWRPELQQAVQNCELLLAMIHAEWHKDQDQDSGEKSLMQEFDWVRQEIGAALKAGKVVIPVLVDQAYLTPSAADLQRTSLPRNKWLPKDLHDLYAKQYFRLRFDDLTPHRLGEFLGHLGTHLTGKWQVTARTRRGDEGGYYPGVLQETFPLPEQLQQAAPVSPSPYVGLRPFRREDARLFYGRSREIFDLCHKLNHRASRLLLLDGYSGTGKSSLLQAGLIPRMEAQGWAVAYARREEGKTAGLPHLLAEKLAKLPTGQVRKLMILDQLEEVLTNPIPTLPEELACLIDALVDALEADRDLKVALGFRSEYAVHIKRQLDPHVEKPRYDSDNTLHTLERQGLVEAIRSVSVDSTLNGPGKHYHLRFRPSRTLPETIAQRLLDSKAGHHIAPLLQVNLELLWQNCRRDDGVVITGADIRNLIDNHEHLLDHYLAKVREYVTSDQMDDQRLLELLHFYIEQKPASALRPDREFEQKFGDENFAPKLRDACKQLFLLYSQGSGDDAITRLSHDSLAEVIYGRYSQLTEAKVVARGTLAFDSLKREIDEQIESLQYRQALDTLDRMMTVEEQRRQLHPYFFELTFFWNEAGQHQETSKVLQYWINSGLLSGALRERASRLLEPAPPRPQFRNWLALVDPARYADMQTRYLAPEQTVMVQLESGKFMMGRAAGAGDADAQPVHPVQLSSFWLGNVPVTWRQYALYFFANQQDGELVNKAPSWGLKGSHPACSVDWYESVEYCNWLSQHEGLTPAYAIDRSPDPGNLSEDDEKKWTVRRIDNTTGFRLPTEAEWEYACRAGTTTDYSFGDYAE